MEEKKRAINWYPGHMTKARRMMEEDIKLVDLVIEIVDARIPLSSRNPDIDKLEMCIRDRFKRLQINGMENLSEEYEVEYPPNEREKKLES